MKTIKYFLLFSYFCLSSISINATVTTWIGGTGEWEDDNNWDTGQVPTLDDGVIINSGIVTVESYAEASYIHLDGGDLDVNGTLYVVPEDGWYGLYNQKKGLVIENGSSYNNYGSTVIQESWDFIGSGHLIFCNGDMTNHHKGLILLIGYNCTGIHSYIQSGTIYNYGKIEMSPVKSGMYLLSSFSNYGNIEITSSNIGITNTETFYSGTSSNLEVNGRITNNAGAVWNQYGDVEVHHTSSDYAPAISMNGTFEIQNSGSLLVDGSHEAVSIPVDGTLRVRGDLVITNDRIFESSLSISGFMVNHQKGIVTTKGHYGVHTAFGGEVRNYGIWNVEGNQGIFYCTLWNSGVFSNRPKGKLYVEGRLNLKTGSTFNNQGHMFVLDDYQHVDISGQFNNTATLNDVHDRMTAINNNTSIRVHKMSGSWTEGVPVSNVLDVGASPGSTVLSWYTTPTGNTTAGTYNISTNTFTPNSNAVGLSSLFVRTRINAGGVTRRHELIIENGINGSPAPFNQPNKKDILYSNSEMIITPNPISGNFSINLRNTEEEGFNYTIFNSMGQKMFSGEFDANSNLIQVPQYLNSGIYFIRVDNINGEHIDTKKVRIVQ